MGIFILLVRLIPILSLLLGWIPAWIFKSKGGGYLLWKAYCTCIVIVIILLFFNAEVIAAFVSGWFYFILTIYVWKLANPNEFGELKKITIGENWTVQVGNKFEIVSGEVEDLVLKYNETKVIFSIRVEDKSKEELFSEFKALQKDTKELKLKEFEFNINYKILYGYLQNYKGNNAVEFLHELNTFTFIDNEYIVITYYFKDENKLEWAINTWKYLENNKAEEDNLVKDLRQTLKENEVIVKVLANGRLEKWNQKDWDEVVKIGNSSKFELK